MRCPMRWILRRRSGLALRRRLLGLLGRRLIGRRGRSLRLRGNAAHGNRRHQRKTSNRHRARNPASDARHVFIGFPAHVSTLSCLSNPRQQNSAPNQHRYVQPPAISVVWRTITARFRSIQRKESKVAIFFKYVQTFSFFSPAIHKNSYICKKVHTLRFGGPFATTKSKDLSSSEN